MSALDGNPYHADALVSMGQAVRNMPAQPEKLAVLAQADATLALAFEQRTANLIAFLQYADGDSYGAIHDQISTRLNLRPTRQAD